MELSLRDCGEVAVFWEVLPDQTVRVFVSTSPPGCVGMSKVKASIQLFADGFVSGSHGDLRKLGR